MINAPVDQVWEYLADDETARTWSIFFWEIVKCPIQACPQNKNKEAQEVGFIRRSYRNKNHNGLFWDEETLSIEKSEKQWYRSILAHNFHGYGMIYEKAEHLVEQVYEPLASNQTKLIFQTRLVDRDKLRVNQDDDLNNDVGPLAYFVWSVGFRIGQWRAGQIFQKNLENIKYNIENGENDHPLFGYEKFCTSDFCRWLGWDDY